MDQPPEAPPPGDARAQRAFFIEWGKRQVLDVRTRSKAWFPRYIIRDYGERLGTNGLAVYLILCHYATGMSPVAFPGLNRMAKVAGSSRSTFVRTIRHLAELNLVKVYPIFDEKGQHNNVYLLIDPPEQNPPPDNVDEFTEPPVNMECPPCPIDTPPVSDRHTGGVNLTAPTLRSEAKDPKGGGGEPPPGSPAAEISALDSVCERFLTLLFCPFLPRRQEISAEIRSEVSELLRRGYSREQLLASLDEKERDRSEFPRVWRSRVSKRKIAPRRAPLPHHPADDAERRKLLDEYETSRREILQAGSFSELVKQRVAQLKINGSSDSQIPPHAPLDETVK